MGSAFFTFGIVVFYRIPLCAAAEQSDDALQEEIAKAHVVCVVYSVEDDSTLDRITSHWLPFIRDATPTDQRTPVVLVGNKVDLVDYSTIDVRFSGFFFCGSVGVYD